MKFVHYTFDNSTSEVPHFEINAFVGDEWAGHYQRRRDWIENVFVNEEMRGKGVCKKMMRHAIKHKKHLILLVKNDNDGARRCYLAVGFKPIATIEDMTFMTYTKQ